MAQPTFVAEVNEGTEATPSWTTIVTAIRWTGAGGPGNPQPAPVLDATDSFFDDGASPNDGELWHDKVTDVQLNEAGRNTNQNVLRIRESGGQPTVGAPEFTAYDDATDAGNRTDPTVWLLTGTTGTSNISTIRAIETTGGAPGAGWTGQTHAAAPAAGSALDGNKSGEKETFAAAYAGSDSKTLNLAACVPHDPGSTGVVNFVYCMQYVWS